MAQGAIKKGAKPAPARNTKKPKRGARVAKPRKATSADKIQKKYSAGLIGKTEKLLGERAGHLELIGKGKKGPKSADSKAGSRKFG